jgi:hypothetical protein
MEVDIRASPFRKLQHNHFATIDILLYIEHFKALEFLFKTNKLTRKFVEHHFEII